MWMAFAVTQAEEESPTRGISLSTAEDRSLLLNSEIERAQKDLAARLNTTRPTAEQRAIQIDQWQEENRTLADQAKEAQVALAALKVTPTPAVESETDDNVSRGITGDPLLDDIHDIEADIAAFQKSLETSKLTAEQRAIQVEQFHQLNRVTLEELELMKSNVIQQENSGSANRGTLPLETVAESSPPSGRVGYLKTELDRIAVQISKLNPEDRANYFETHAETLSAMGKELSATIASSTSDIDPASNIEPTTSQEPAAKTDP